MVVSVPRGNLASHRARRRGHVGLRRQRRASLVPRRGQIGPRSRVSRNARNDDSLLSIYARVDDNSMNSVAARIAKFVLRLETRFSTVLPAARAGGRTSRCRSFSANSRFMCATHRLVNYAIISLIEFQLVHKSTRTAAKLVKSASRVRVYHFDKARRHERTKHYCLKRGSRAGRKPECSTRKCPGNAPPNHPRQHLHHVRPSAENETGGNARDYGGFPESLLRLSRLIRPLVFSRPRARGGERVPRARRRPSVTTAAVAAESKPLALSFKRSHSRGPARRRGRRRRGNRAFAVARRETPPLRFAQRVVVERLTGEPRRRERLLPERRLSESLLQVTPTVSRPCDFVRTRASRSSVRSFVTHHLVGGEVHADVVHGPNCARVQSKFERAESKDRERERPHACA